MKELRTEIGIDASAERVWACLTDFASFPEWNPFIRNITGRLEIGTRLDVILGATGTKPMAFRPTVRRVVPNCEFRWLGRVGIPGLFDGEHIFELTPSARTAHGSSSAKSSEGCWSRSSRGACIGTPAADSRR